MEAKRFKPNDVEITTDLHFCKVCKLSIRGGQSEWLDHLISIPHQITASTSAPGKINFGGMQHWDGNRSLLISISGNIGNENVVNAKELLEYLSGWSPSPVQDFSYKGTKIGYIQHCFALLEHPTTVKMICKSGASHSVGGRTYLIKQMTKRPFPTTVQKSSPKNTEPEIPPKRIQTTTTQQQCPTNSGGQWNCGVCQVEAFAVSEWIEHLTSGAHRKLQSQQEGAGLKSWDYRNGLSLKGIEGLDTRDILHWAVESWGPIKDIIHHEVDHNYMRILFHSQETVDAILSFKDFLFIGSKRVEAEALPEFAGHSKKEKQALRAQKEAEEKPKPLPSILFKQTRDRELDALSALLEGKGLQDQISTFLKQVSWTPGMLQGAKKMTEAISQLVTHASHRIIRECQVLPFGPCEGGLALKSNRVVNMLLILDAVTDEISIQSGLIHDLRLLLTSFVASWFDINPLKIEAALITLPDSTSQTAELSFSTLSEDEIETQFKLRFGMDPLAPQESLLISTYTKLDPRVEPLLKIISVWTSINKLLIPSDELYPHHLIHVLVIFFLQQQKILPRVKKLQEIEKEQKMQETPQNGNNAYEIPCKNGYPMTFCTNPDLLTKGNSSLQMLQNGEILSLSILGLLKSFFGFYTGMDYDGQVISLFLGESIPKDKFKLPEGSVGGLSLNSAFVVQDPFLLNVNLAKNVSKKARWRFQGNCKGAAKKLEWEFANDRPSLQGLFSRPEKPEKWPVL